MSEGGRDASPKREESESDEDGAVGSKGKRKHLRVLSDGESSDSSVPEARRTRMLPQLQDYSDDSESDWESDNSEEANAAEAKPAGCASDSSEGNSDKCPICLLRFKDQSVGIPENCEHMFCVDCITEWSKNVNTCPVDRMTFASIVVRACAGGRVLHTRPVVASKSEPFMDMFEDEVTRCQVCNSPDNEAQMLLCDHCDHGFHMMCLSPPLDEIPDDEWFCPNCEPRRRVDIDSSNAFVERVQLRLGRPAEASRRRALAEPAASAGGSRARRKTTGKRRARRRTRTVVHEYEVQNGGKFPIKKRIAVKKRAKKRKVKKRAPRTAARRSLVRASVRERLATLRSQLARTDGASEEVQQLAITRHRAGIPALSLFGDRNDLDYLSEDEADETGGGSTYAVALRPTASVLSAYRQARRKMISIPSPPHASSVPDLLSNIMESQNLLHSKKSLISVTVDGTVNIKLQSGSKNKANKQNPIRDSPVNGLCPKKDDKVDLSAGENSSRKAPSYPGHSRGGGWNGGYRGGYQGRDNGNNNNWGNNGNSNYSRNSYGGNYHGNSGFNQGSQGNSYHQNSDTWNRDSDPGYQDRRSHYQYENQDEEYNNRQNMQRPPANNANQNMLRRPDYARSASDQGRSSWAPSWQQQRQEPQMRHSFGGFEQGMDALDMRMGQGSADINETDDQPDLYGDMETPREPTPPQHYEPLPEPPVFRFVPPADVDKSEDERSDSGLVIDTEKYDPTEPTHDESSGEEERVSGQINFNASLSSERSADIPFDPQMSFEQIPPRPIESSPLKVPSGLLDKAVAQVLNEHRNLIGSSPVSRPIVDDDDSEGDCPNFSIYSATSVNIANSSESILASSSKIPENEYLEKEEDLVQEDDDIPTPEEETVETEASDSLRKNEKEEDTLSAKEKAAREEYEERLSRKCPITPNKRNPIKIKLTNTTPLIKRHVLDLYSNEDEEEEEAEQIFDSKTTVTPNKSDKLDFDKDEKKEKEKESPKKSESESETIHSKEFTVEEVPEILIEKEKVVTPNEEIKSRASSDDEDLTKDESITSDKQAVNESDRGDEEVTEDELPMDRSDDRRSDGTPDNAADALEKMTESISESEDERSYTPCLDENKSKEDTSFENEKENLGIEGLDTEMISEDEGNEMFSDTEEQNQRKESDHDEASLERTRTESFQAEEGEIFDKANDTETKDENEEEEKEGKKKKRKEKKDKAKGKKKSDITFKKLSKSGKERNYRDKEDKGKTKGKDRKKSDDKENKEKRDKKREKRKDMERYDVRNIVSEKRRRVKDAFGRDTSRPRSKSPSLPPSLSPPPHRSLSRGRRSMSIPRRSLSHARSVSKSKDRYTPSLGRRSIRRSLSRGRKSMTPIRIPISPRIRKSISPRGQSPLSPRRRSISPRMRRSISPRIRRSVSPQLRRSITPRMRRSISPRIRRSISRTRRSISPRIRRSISPRIRRSITPRRRSISRGRRSISHRKRKSISPRIRRKVRRSASPRKRSASPRQRRSQSRGRKRPRSKTPKAMKSKSPRKKARRSRSRLRSLSRNRSRTPKLKKTRRMKPRKSKSPRRKTLKDKKRVSRSITPGLMLSPEMMRERVPPVWRSDKVMYQEWSDSRSINSRLMSPSWTPPRVPSPEPHHLRVYLTNKDKSKRKEKKKRRESEKRRELIRRPPDTGPSKEVFTSGNNILVSVSFNKDELGENQDPSAMELGSKKRKRKSDAKKDRRERLKKRRTERKKDTENKKPVAIIDLEKSPFRELTPSPKNIIVLSDSDQGEKEDESLQRQQIIRNELREAPPVQPEVVESSVHREPPFLNSVGPKTPPEPSVKFSIMPKVATQLRSLNPLHEEDEADNQEGEENQDTVKDGTHKGPNTPPDPPNTPPSSPDAYDPFEPTKSGSATPEQEQNGKENTDIQEKATITLETAQKTNLSADDVLNQRPITPIEKVMALLQSTRNVSPTNVTDDITTEQPVDPEVGATVSAVTNSGQSPDRASTGTSKSGPPQSHFSLSVAPTVSSAPIYLSTGIPRIGAFNNASPRANSGISVTLNQRIVLPSPTKSSPLKTQPSKLFLAKPSPIKSTPIKPMPSKTIISKLPLPNVKPIPGRKKNNRPTEILDLDSDMDSPYSPGSSDFGDLFEPPADANSKSYSKSGKTDMFDSLFGSKNKKSKSSATKVPVKQIKKKGKTQVGVKIDEDSLKILDDLPSSAVEMQVKSKFLKKLNRQERVVEEVKLVLKPHYNKKHVTKEQYKDVLRKAVPKICHNKTGEINVAKIQALVEAYVRKFRKKNKSTSLL